MSPVKIKHFLTAVSAVVFVIAGISASSAQARRSSASPPKIEDLPCFPVDTIATDDHETFVILFSNNTWKYYRPALRRLNDLEVYTQHWDTTQVFAYKSIELADLPPVIDLKLITSLDDFHYPIKGCVFSKYGPRGRRNHNGVDIPLKTGDPIYSVFDGRVRYARFNSGGFGNLIIVRHANGLETWYAHLSRNNVRAGDYVKSGQIIGYGGSTGRSRGPHLHFEMRYCDQTFDPEFIVDFESGNIRYQTFALEKSFFSIRSRATDQLEEDDDFENYAFAASGEGEDPTSEEIIARLESNKGKSSSAKTAQSSGDAVYHKIVQNDYLGKLARRYGVTVGQICRLNNITENTTLKLGKTLRIK